jgi:hypothetical protein
MLFVALIVSLLRFTLALKVDNYLTFREWTEDVVALNLLQVLSKDAESAVGYCVRCSASDGCFGAAWNSEKRSCQLAFVPQVAANVGLLPSEQWAFMVREEFVCASESKSKLGDTLLEYPGNTRNKKYREIKQILRKL